MFASKMSALKPLIESKEGQHLTAYLRNDQNIFQLRRQLRETLDTAYEYLAPVMNPAALVRFVAPLHNAIEDTKLLRNLKANVGVFRNESSFRILSIPIPVEPTCVVATSFHVKPLLRWIQTDREFLLLGISEESATLYYGNQVNLSVVDTVVFPGSFQASAHPDSYQDLKNRRLKRFKFSETAEWLSEWIVSLTKDTKPQLFVSGQKDLADAFLKRCRYKNVRLHIDSSSFSQAIAPRICSEIRSIVKQDVKDDFERALVEFYQAEDLNLANRDIFQIAKAAIKGKVKKLIIADGINIFGKIDKKSGGLKIHSTHLDHEDDDILDDLAQEVLAQGGEVVVASIDEIPKRRPILAILERPDSDLPKVHSTRFAYEQKNERTAV